MTYLTLTYLVITYIALFVTAICYVAVMHFKRMKKDGTFDSLHWSTKALGYQMLYIGLVADFLLNVVLSIPFLELPRIYAYPRKVSFRKMTLLPLSLNPFVFGDWKYETEFLTTGRIKRHYWNTNGGWRHRFARFFATNYLLPFDKNHMN